MAKGFLGSLFGEPDKPNSASIAKDRLKVIVATHHLNDRLPPERIEAMKQEILVVVNRYVSGVRMNDVNIQQRKENDLDILEMNVNLPERPEA
ncbi:MAG: cell division topological specificity factor MinE [Moraxella sp.]|nr:cell division topological specificity factor MinE [Moraxella sp.]